MRSIRALKPNVTREDAIERFTAARWWTGLTATLPSTRTIAELYIPYRIFRVEISQGDHPEIRFLGIDAASGSLDLYGFDQLPGPGEVVVRQTRNAVNSQLSDALASEQVVEKVRRIL